VLAVLGVMFLAILGAINFLYIRLTELGGSPSDVALAGGLSALAEIPGMILAASVAARIGLRGLFLLSAVAYSACMASWGLIDQPAAIIASRALSGPAFAGLWVACVLTINVLLPQRLQATGQALYQTTAFGIGAMVGNLVGGVVYQGLGPSTLFLSAAAIGGLAAIAGWFVLPRSRDLRGAADPPSDLDAPRPPADASALPGAAA
jgi:MFS family permease